MCTVVVELIIILNPYPIHISHFTKDYECAIQYNEARMCIGLHKNIFTLEKIMYTKKHIYQYMEKRNI